MTMNRSILAVAWLAAWATGWNSEAQQEAPKPGDVHTEIRAQKALSYVDVHGLTISEFTKASIRLKGLSGKVKEIALSGDVAKTETQEGGILRTITLNGNVRAEEPDGTVTTADEAVLDLIAGVHTYAGKVVRIVTSGK